jgi:hypothetical protein
MEVGIPRDVFFSSIWKRLSASQMHERETRLAIHFQILYNLPWSAQSVNSITSVTKNTLLIASAKSRSVSAWATILSSKHNQVL